MVLACFGSRLMPAKGDEIGPEFILKGLGKQAAGRGRERFVLFVFLSMISRELNPKKTQCISRHRDVRLQLHLGRSTNEARGRWPKKDLSRGRVRFGID